MAKSHYAYHDENVEFIGSVTTVDGLLKLTESTYNNLQEKMIALEDAYDKVVQEVPVIQFEADDPESFEEVGYVTRAEYRAKAYSKCDEEDVYDAKLGLIIASRKAELKNVSKAFKDILALNKAISELHSLVSDMHGALYRRKENLEKELAFKKLDSETKGE